MKYLIAVRFSTPADISNKLFEFNTKKDRQEFIKELERKEKNLNNECSIEWATTEVKENKQ